MQSTLLGLAIAIILALVTALVAPLVVDWSRYRSVFEQEASRLTGLAVRVDGSIDARILPSPHIKLRDVAIGAGDQPPQVRAAMIELEVGLGPLLRGQLRASELRVVAPQISLGLDHSGAIDWPGSTASLRPEAVTVSRLTIEDGRVVLTDAGSGSQLVLQQVSFNGDVRSLAGAFGGDGAFVVGNTPYGYRLSGNREDDGGLKLRLGLDPADYPLTTDIDGTLSFADGVPQFAGTLALARPAGAALAHGQRVMSDPWHLTGAIQATPAAASLQDLALQYGPDERAINFTGKAELTFGGHPHLTGTVLARQVDVDRALADPDATHRPPFVMAKAFLEAFVAAVRPPLPADIGVGIDAVTVGGTVLQSLHGDLGFDDKGWRLDGLTFRAPGLTEVNLSGRLDRTAQGLAFSGPARLQSADLKTLMAWLEGRSDAPSGPPQSLTAQGEVAVSADRLALDRLSASLDEEKVEGRLGYRFAAQDRPAALEGELSAAELDVDALRAFAKATGTDGSFALPHQAALALDVGKATFAGIDARAINAKIKFDAGILHIDRLSIADLGGAALDISGHIDELSSQPRGSLTLDLDAKALAGLTAVVGKFAPQTAAVFGQFADRLAPAKMHGVLTVERAATAGSVAKLDLAGDAGALRVALNGEARGEPEHLGEAVVRVDSRLDADDGNALTQLLRLDRVLAVDQLPGEMTLSAGGPLNGELHVNALAAAGGFSATATGTLRLTGEQAPTGSLQLQAAAADLRPLQRGTTGQPGAAIPIASNANVAIAGGTLSFTDLTLAVGKSSLHGRLALTLATPVGIEGDVAADDVDAAALSALFLGLPSTAAGAPGGGGPWSAEPIGVGAVTAMRGRLTFKFDRAAFMPGLVVRKLRGVARFEPSAIAVEGIDGSLAGGRLTGQLAFRHDAEQLAAKGDIELAGADAAAILASDPKAVDGLLTMKFSADSIGMSPAALIGSLHGSGAMTLTNAHFLGVDTAAFDAAMLAADQSETVDAAKIRAAVAAALANGRLAVPDGHADVTITAGQVRLANTTLTAERGAELSLDGVLDLTTSAIDGRMILAGQPAANALIRTRPELAIGVQGALAAPKRSLDLSALMTWLTLRSAERQSRRLESIEANRRADVLAPVMRPASPAIRFVSPGTVAESAMPASAAAAVPPLAQHGLDRLHTETPAPTTPNDDARSNPGGDRDSAAATAAPASLGMKPVPARPARTDNATAAAGSADPNRRRAAAPQQLAPPPPRSAAPAERSPLLDFLFRSQD